MPLKHHQDENTTVDSTTSLGSTSSGRATVPNAGRVGCPIDAVAEEYREISRILKRVPKNRPTFQIANALLRDGRFSLSTIEPLLTVLRDRSANHWRERQAAA